MSRIAPWLGLALIPLAASLNAQAVPTASFAVSLAVRETCLVDSPRDETGATKEPLVSCLHDSPYRTKRVTTPAPGKVIAPSPSAPMTWLVLF